MNETKDIKNISYVDMTEIKQIINDMYWHSEENKNPGKFIYNKCQEILIILNRYNIFKEE